MSNRTVAPRLLQVLVTGGSGFVGRAAIRELLGRGHTVIATTTRLTQALPSAPKLHWVRWDALTQPLPVLDWGNTNAILHLAAPAKPFRFPESAPALYELVVAAGFRLLEAARAYGIRRVLVASTGHALGSQPRPADEDDCTYRPIGFYGSVKACTELLFRAYEPALSTAVLRFYYPYGPDSEEFLVHRMLRFVREGKEIAIEGEDGIRVNPVWIGDLAWGIRLAVESDEPGVFHFPGPDTMTFRELLETIGALVNRKPVIRVTPARGVEFHAGTCEATRRVLGYEPRVTIRAGLRRLLEASPGLVHGGAALA